MLEIRALYGGYGKEDILQGVELCAAKGAVTAVVGANGCGKTTLLKSVAGILKPRAGEILWNGEELSSLRATESAKRVAYLSQSAGIPEATVEGMVLQGRFPYLSYPRRYREGDYLIAQRAMERMGLLPFAEKSMQELSGGMRQKVFVAMALAQETDLILLDEPTSYLDIGWQMRLSHILRELAEEGKTIVAVLHDLLLALKLADRIEVMAGGKIVWEGSPLDFPSAGISEALWGVGVKEMTTPHGKQYYYTF